MSQGAILVIGPSCAGKSTFIERELCAGAKDTIMAHDVTAVSGALGGKVIHYNSLRVLAQERAKTRAHRVSRFNEYLVQPDYGADPAWS